MPVLLKLLAAMDILSFFYPKEQNLFVGGKRHGTKAVPVAQTMFSDPIPMVEQTQVIPLNQNRGHSFTKSSVLSISLAFVHEKRRPAKNALEHCVGCCLLIFLLIPLFSSLCFCNFSSPFIHGHEMHFRDTSREMVLYLVTVLPENAVS